MNPVFEPLRTRPRAVILDTDIGPDCDDVGALVCLIHYAKAYGFPITGICNCTSNRSGNGTVDAICRHCGIETPALGQWSGPTFLDDPCCHRYNDAVAEHYSEAFRQGTLSVADEVTFYRTRLAQAEDDGVILITIGMLNNLAALLDSRGDEISPLTGAELVQAKVHCLVSMAAVLPAGREYNVYMDGPAARRVFADWPTPIYLSDFHIGYTVRSGYTHIPASKALSAGPAALAYHLYSSQGENASFDLTAVQFAVLGEGELYGLHDPVELEFYDEAPDRLHATRAIPTTDGKCRFMKKLVEDTVIADSLNQILKCY